MRILVVDDEPDITSGIKGCLEHDNTFQVTAFNNPEEAISNFQSNTYDIALVDIKMPKMNGFQFYKAMSRIDPVIMVFFITAFEMHSNEFTKVFPSSRILGFLRKPFSTEELLQLLETAIDIRT